MSMVSQAGTAVGLLAAASAAVSLWWGAGHHTGPVRRGYRWFSLAAVLWGAGVVVGHVLTVPAGGSSVPLSFGDLPALLAVPVMAAGLARLAAAGRGRAAQAQAPTSAGGRGRVAARVADGYVVAAALFLIGWVALFGATFLKAGVGPATFAAELVHPLADLLLLGGGLSLTVAAGRRGVLPYLAVLVFAVGDSLAVGARISGLPPGVATLLVQSAGLLLLALAPWAGGWRPAPAWWRDRTPAGGRLRAGPGDRSPATQGVPTIVAAVVAGVAALVFAGWALAGESADRPVLAATAGTIVLALALRTAGLVRGDNSASWAWHKSAQQFRQLADRTSDVVLLCDLGGVIRYASRAVAGFGYAPQTLKGTQLADLLHPEDRSGGARAVQKAVNDAAQRVGRYPCRVRAADGTWRHVESTVSRYRESGGPEQLLVTARDMSAQVALRRQVTHLTFHDGLTGLPNRSYVEQRVRNAGGPAADRPSPPAAMTAVIFLDLDGFAAVNAEVGHGTGDLLLAQVGRRLRAAVPPQDTVARWGGDEFAVLIEGAASAGEVAEIAERLARSVAVPPFRAGDRDVNLTASVGVALADGEPEGHVWRNADLMMLRAKEMGGGRVEVYRPGLGPVTGAGPVADVPGRPQAAAS